MDPTLALDRSMRRKDADGHLHVEMTNISKANVCPYYGREIPNWAELGLDAHRVYMLYRDPAELKAAAHTFAGKPLLMHHIPVTADAPATDLVVGAIGTDVRFDHPYLRAPLSVWRGDAIDAIEADPESDEYRGELSPGYRYTADMSPGMTPEGVAFDGRMRNIMANHLAIVSEGRTGRDVVVADELPKDPVMKFAKFFAALAAAFPTLKPEQAVAMDAALDAELQGSAEAAAAAKAASVPAMDEAVVSARVADAVAAAVKDMVPKTEATKLAQDAATAATTSVHALYAARQAVEATVGVIALDSAEAVYRFALDHLKVDHKDIPVSALPALYETSAKAAAAPALATDAAPTGKFDPKILGLSHIRKG